jgi:hypothetical protein
LAERSPKPVKGIALRMVFAFSSCNIMITFEK